MNIFLRYAAETTNLPNHFRTIAYDARILYILSLIHIYCHMAAARI